MGSWGGRFGNFRGIKSRWEGGGPKGQPIISRDCFLLVNIAARQDWFDFKVGFNGWVQG